MLFSTLMFYSNVVFLKSLESSCCLSFRILELKQPLQGSMVSRMECKYVIVLVEMSQGFHLNYNYHLTQCNRVISFWLRQGIVEVSSNFLLSILSFVTRHFQHTHYWHPCSQYRFRWIMVNNVQALVTKQFSVFGRPTHSHRSIRKFWLWKYLWAYAVVWLC